VATTLILLVILLSLGVWQLQRLTWKRGLLAAIDQAEATPAVPLPPNPSQFEKIHVEGRFLADHAALYGDQLHDTPQGPVIGAQLLMPLERPGAPTVLVDRGWIPEHATPPIPSGLVSVEGYVREAEHPHWFSAPDDPTNRRFFTLDPQSIGRALGLGEVAPFTLVVLQPASGQRSGEPIPAEHLPRPPNDHLSYAITWFGLAAVLAVVFGIYAAKSREPS
jgi:surfeit locus 1 family protein